MRKLLKVRLVVVTFVALMLTTGVAHAVKVDTMTLSSVTFADGETVVKDDGSAYPTPHWKKGTNGQPTGSYPICYTGGGTVTASAFFTVTPPNADRKVKIRGTGSNGISFPEKEATPNTGTVDYPETAASSALAANTIQSTSFSIKWEFSTNGGESWSSAGPSEAEATSSNQMYVALSRPTVTLYHTLVDIACRKGAEVQRGTMTDSQYTDAVIEAIWDEFSDRSVSRILDSEVLKYYAKGTATPEYYQTADLLANADGRCGAWMRFFTDVAGVQGIIVTRVGIEAEYAKDAAGYVRKGIVVYPSLKGQGDTTPANRFGDHAVAKYGSSTIYDPSYGKKYAETSYLASQQKWENDSLEAFIFTKYSVALGRDVYYDEDDIKDRPEAKFTAETNSTP